MNGLINGVIGFLMLFYPVVVYFSVTNFEPWMIAGILTLLLIVRFATGVTDNKWDKPLLLAGLVYSGFIVWSNEVAALRYYPVLVNSVMLLIFSASLLFPPSLIERMARMQYPDLPSEGVVYTRRVTQIWCAFFAVNGLAALTTALWSSFEIWSLYNGLITYLLMGTLFLGEYCIRRRQKYFRYSMK